MKNIRPLHDRVIIKRAEAVKEIGGIIIPENAKAKPCEGTVVAVGRGKFLDSGKLREPSVAVGDKVLFTAFGYTELPGDDEQVVIAEENILCVLGDE